MNSAFERTVAHCAGGMLHSGFGTFSFAFSEPPRPPADSLGATWPLQPLPSVLDGIAHAAAEVAAEAVAGSVSASGGTEPDTPSLSADDSASSESGRDAKPAPKQRRAFCELPFVTVTREAARKRKATETRKRSWYWSSDVCARSPLRMRTALVRVSELALPRAEADTLRCAAGDCELVGRIVSCPCDAAALLCPLHCVDHYAAIVRTGHSACQCPVEIVAGLPAGFYVRSERAHRLCATVADERRADADMLRVVERFVDGVADAGFVRTPRGLRSPLAGDQALTIATRIKQRLLCTDTRAKRRARRKLFSPPPPPASLPVPEITVQSAPAWPPQPPPLAF